MRKILIWATTLLLTNVGSYFFRGCQSAGEITDLKVAVNLKKDSLVVVRDSVVLLKFLNSKLKQLDSSNRFFIGEKEKLLMEQRNIMRANNTELIALRKWKLDAEADGIITPDTVKVKKRWFKKGYKVLRN